MEIVQVYDVHRFLARFERSATVFGEGSVAVVQAPVRDTEEGRTCLEIYVDVGRILQA